MANTPTQAAAPRKDRTNRWVAARRLGRLAAVQALYQMASVPQPVDKTITEFQTHRLPELSALYDGVAPDATLFADIVRGVSQQNDEIDDMLRAVLVEDWTVERLDAVLRAILRAGAYEIAYRFEMPRAVIVNEYLEVARGFFDRTEIGLINGVLDRLAEHLRPQETKSAPSGQ